ncbi:hypothetical protein F383_22620 [Gossypium arboreum]|uniref:Uncharacterized protein n=1 Tax=Gossypium arboreum TaxID=29729 RepID=A0A0B0P069_GOSAR|nr:hypothetical protein F383_22620 [Gossypium arboreum]
MTNCHFWI